MFVGEDDLMEHGAVHVLFNHVNISPIKNMYVWVMLWWLFSDLWVGDDFPPVSGSRGVLVRAARWNGGTWHPQTIGGRYVPTATNILWDCNRLRTWAWPCSSWIYPLKMVIFHRFGTEVLWISIQWGMSSSQLMNSIIFRRGRYTTDRERLIIKYTPYMGIYCDWCGDKYNTSIYEHHT